MKESGYREILDPATEQLEIRTRFCGPPITRRAPVGRRFASIVKRAGMTSMFDLLVSSFATEAEASEDLAKKLRKSNTLGILAGEVVAVARASITCPCCEGLGHIPKVHHLYRMPPQSCPVCLIGRIETTTPEHIDRAYTKWRRATGDQISLKDRRRCAPLTWFGRTWDYDKECAVRIAATTAEIVEQTSGAESLTQRAARLGSARFRGEHGSSFARGYYKSTEQRRHEAALQAEELEKRMPEIRRRAAKDRRRQLLIVGEMMA